MKKDNVILDKSMDFAVRIVNLYKYISCEKHEYVISKQMLRSGTSIGANAREAVQGNSKSDFTYKMNISLKEVSETEYWLELLFRTEFITEGQYLSLAKDCEELGKILTSIVKSSK